MPAGPYDFLSPEQIKSFDENGYAIVEDAFTSEETSLHDHAKIIPAVSESTQNSISFLLNIISYLAIRPLFLI